MISFPNSVGYARSMGTPVNVSLDAKLAVCALPSYHLGKCYGEPMPSMIHSKICFLRFGHATVSLGNVAVRGFFGGFFSRRNCRQMRRA